MSTGFSLRRAPARALTHPTIMASEITLPELQEKMQRHDDFALVEALPPWHYRQQHLPGAINIPFNRVERYARQRIPNKDQEVIVYCGKFT